jgi:hypothetical protein
VSPQQQAEAHEAIAVALERLPSLRAFGLSPARFEGEPRPLSDHLDEIATSIAFLRHCAPARSLCSSYHLKHLIEAWGREHRMSPYVANGAAIAAAVYLGFAVGDPTGPNIDIGVSRRSLMRMRVA